MKSKKAIAMSFNWIFAIIVGGIILVLAIYAVSNLIDTGEDVIYTETAAKIITLLDPAETGLASGKSSEINFKKETRTFYTCDELSNRPFGEQTISFTEKSFGDEFGNIGSDVSVKNKYVFAEDAIEGQNLYLFSKPFFMGFKVADLIMISSENYCFINAPNEIKSEILELTIKNIQIGDFDNCTGINVCFDINGDCDIEVSGKCLGYQCESEYDEGIVLKSGRPMFYSESLLYAAIFSSPGIYECNVKRLMNKFNELALVYINKANIIQNKDCNSNLEPDLRLMISSAKALNSSRQLSLITDKSKEVYIKDRAATCGLF
jgi:hypothetical protein